MTPFFCIFALMTLAGAVAAMTLRGMVHCALALTIAFSGLGALFVDLGAEFPGLAQILVYAGAVAILIVFAILLTRGGEDEGLESVPARAFSLNAVMGIALAAMVFATLAWAIVRSGVGGKPALGSVSGTVPVVSMFQIGSALLGRFALPLEVIGLTLTAALVGAIILAVSDTQAGDERQSAQRGKA